MSVMQWLMILIFLATFIGLLKYQHIPERIFAGATLVCLAASFVSSAEILNNAVNSGLVTLLLLVLCSFAFERTSVLRRLSASMINGSQFKSTIKTLLGTAIASAVMNNTAVVATLIGSIKKNTLINPGKLLLPLSYAAILGGTLTLVGTSTNLIVNSMWIEQGQQSFAFFDFTLIGATALVVCLFIVIVQVKKLPDMKVSALKTEEYLLEADVSNSSK